jgi:NTE family protein
MSTLDADVRSPVAGTEEAGPADGTALCLSGGGYRAMVFHLGVLWRLNEWGRLATLDRISSVSGGSITSAVLGLKWSHLEFSDGVAQRLVPEVVDAVRGLARVTIDIGAGLKGLFLPGSVSERVQEAYDKHLFHGATLQDLPDAPRFVINATNVQSGALWRFSKPYMRDYKVGQVRNPRVALAAAVAASSAFPPLLSPALLKLDPSDFAPSEGEPLHRDEYMRSVFLTDGGVYDNLGLETAWKRCATLLVSDAGLAMDTDPRPDEDWARHIKRVLDLVDNQVRALRKRQLVASLRNGDRRGAYWSIRSAPADYGAGSGLHLPAAHLDELANVPTRLASMPDELQERLINWGYAMCDIAMRSWVDPALPAATAFPYARGV